ncbi:MAG: T9SS type A sorting domain-containing protein, partial [Candidatus Kapaibacterium sp.]
AAGNNGTCQLDNVAGGDLLNLRNGATAGLALRARNPVDSAELRWHIPSTGYKNLVVKFVVESSSTTSGDSTQVYSYSVDGGTTWKTTGMTVNGSNVDTLDTTPPQFQGSSWGLVAVTFGSDASVNNNPNLIFRITFRGNTHILSGNNRFDDFTLDGVQGVSASVSPLIHYWHFDSLNTAYHNPGIPVIPADYSAISPNPAKILYVLEPGTSSTYAGYLDNVAGDTTNSQLGAVAGQALRVRNPSDSMELRFVIPTTGYNNISFQYALESSSTTSGQLVEHFDYSPDGGTTWKSSSLTVYGANVDTLDVTNPIFQGTSWGLVTIGFGSDTSVNNNPNLILRIKFSGNTSKTSGNNRFDNVTVEGTQIGQVVTTPASISVLTPSAGDTIYAGAHQTISYAIAGPVTLARSIDYSTDGGKSWLSIASGVATTAYDWVVPQVTSFSARVRVRDANGVIGISPEFVILTPGKVSRVEITSVLPITGSITNILWYASGYLGSTVNIDVSFDGKQTWMPVVQNYAYGSKNFYTWTVPQTPDTDVILRVTFAEGAVGYSAPFTISAPTAGVSNGNNTNAAVQVWPNPSHGMISISNPHSGNCEIIIFDVTGRAVLDMPNRSGGVLSVDGSALAPGAYRFTIQSGGEHTSGEFIIR